MNKLRKNIRWFGEYKEILFEVNSFKLGDRDAWTYYLHLLAEQFPEEERKAILPTVYFTNHGSPLSVSRASPLNDLEWHGGCTYLAQEHGNVFTAIKMGCDFNHLWDEGHDYDISFVADEAKKCIESLWVKYPNLKTQKQLWEEHRQKFKAVNNSEHRTFDINANPIEVF